MLKYDTSSYIEKANKIHEGKYDYSKTIYSGIMNKIVIICYKHGEFLKTANKHLNGQGCPKCSRDNAFLSKEEFIEKAKQLHDNKYDYSKVEYIRSKIKVKIVCPKHSEFEQEPRTHLEGHGCYKCGRDDMVNSLNRERHEIIEINGIKLKICSGCKKQKTVESFNIANHTLTGFHYKCRKCISEDVIFKLQYLLRDYMDGKKIKRGIEYGLLYSKVKQHIGIKPFKDASIDHIFPSSYFDHEDLSEIYACWFWLNFRWLGFKENSSKNNKYDEKYLTKYKTLTKELWYPVENILNEKDDIENKLNIFYEKLEIKEKTMAIQDLIKEYIVYMGF